MTVWYWNIQRKLYEVEWQNLFGNWCIVRKLKQRWNHGELTTENWSSQHYTCRKFCCRNLFLTWNIGKFKPLLYGIGIFKENGMKLVYWQKIIAKMKSWCADNQKLSIAALYMQKILLQKFFFLTENFQKYWPLRYGIIKQFCMK